MFYILIGPQGIEIRGPFGVKAYLQVGQDYLVYTLKKDLPFSLFFLTYQTFKSLEGIIYLADF